MGADADADETTASRYADDGTNARTGRAETKTTDDPTDVARASRCFRRMVTDRTR